MGIVCLCTTGRQLVFVNENVEIIQGQDIKNCVLRFKGQAVGFTASNVVFTSSTLGFGVSKNGVCASRNGVCDLSIGV